MWPMWVHALIGRYWQAIEAEDLHNQVVAATAPHAKQSDYRQLMASLEESFAILRPARAAVEPMHVERIDPSAAAEWFAAQGVKVVKSG